MYKIKELPLDSYVAKQENFGYIRRGDYIAILALLQSLRFQYKKNLRFYIEPNPHIEDISLEFVHTFLDKKGAHVKIPFHGNIWAYYDYIHKILDVKLRIPNNHKFLDHNKRRIVVNPIFDAGYNRDRNWSRTFYSKLIMSLASSLIDSELVIMGTKKMIGNPTQLKNVRYVLDNLNESMREINKADVYIGGDTGLTHFASTSDKHPSLIIALYGWRASWRHNEQCQPNVDSILKEYVEIPNEKEIRPILQVNFAPKVPNSKELVYLHLDKEGGLSDNHLSRIVHECRPNRTASDPAIPPHDKIVVAEKIKSNISDTNHLTIVEAGRIIIDGQMPTQFFSHLLTTRNGTLYSVTPSYKEKLHAVEELRKYHLYTDDVYVVVEDGHVFLKNWILNLKKPIDIFSITSINSVSLLNTIMPCLRTGSLVVVNPPNENKAREFLLSKNFECLHDGLQILFRKAA